MLFNNGARMEKSSGKYGFFSNLHYHFRNLRKWEPVVFWISYLSLIPWTINCLIKDILPSAIVAGLCEADLLVLLSDIDGLYDADPKTHPDAKLLHRVVELTPEILEMAGGAGTWRGTGGMTTKLSAAKIAMEAGCDMVITNGQRPEDLYGIVEGQDIGTRFAAGKGGAQ